MTVEIAVVKNPMMRLALSEAINSLSFQASEYHFHVNPLQIVLKRELLNDKSISTRIGA